VTLISTLAYTSAVYYKRSASVNVCVDITGLFGKVCALKCYICHSRTEEGCEEDYIQPSIIPVDDGCKCCIVSIISDHSYLSLRSASEWEQLGSYGSHGIPTKMGIRSSGYNMEMGMVMKVGKWK